MFSKLYQLYIPQAMLDISPFFDTILWSKSSRVSRVSRSLKALLQTDRLGDCL